MITDEEYTEHFYGTEKIGKILLKIAPPVMLAQLIQALYNIVDSFFIGNYSGTGLTALSVIYPVQLLMIAFGVGTGVGINTCMAYYFGVKNDKKAEEIAGIGTPLAVIMWVAFAAVFYFAMPAYARMSTDSADVINDAIVYGRIVCVFSIGIFTEGVWSKNTSGPRRHENAYGGSDRGSDHKLRPRPIAYIRARTFSGARHRQAQP